MYRMMVETDHDETRTKPTTVYVRLVVATYAKIFLLSGQRLGTRGGYKQPCTSSLLESVFPCCMFYLVAVMYLPIILLYC